MKKVIKISAVAALGMIALASCKKDYACTCTDVTGTFSNTSTYINTKADIAETNCNSEESSYDFTIGVGLVNCTLTKI